jgi:hypothetical protein
MDSSDRLGRSFAGTPVDNVFAATVILGLLPGLFGGFAPVFDTDREMFVPPDWNALVALVPALAERVSRLKLDMKCRLEPVFRDAGIRAFRLAGRLEYSFHDLIAEPLLTAPRPGCLQIPNRHATLAALSRSEGLDLNRLHLVAIPHVHCWVAVDGAAGPLNRKQVSRLFRKAFPAPAQSMVKEMLAPKGPHQIDKYLVYAGKFQTSYPDCEVLQLVAEDAAVGRGAKAVRWGFGQSSLFPSRRSPAKPVARSPRRHARRQAESTMAELRAIGTSKTTSEAKRLTWRRQAWKRRNARPATP